ncbi:signal peptidase II [Sulfuricaulis limicola]|uniref:signal peptidase II n=1 Tax=Sulfuricaulis limicola TaxID=1620215 RepID=UPI000BBAD23C|nr:signal peptidase II [Sulfuricaulis limicola]
MARFIRIVVVAITLLSCVGCDQATKAVAKEYLPRNEVLSFAHDTFRLQYVENPGAFLSIGASLPEKARGLLFTVGIATILFGILSYLLFAPALQQTTIFSLSLIVGGGLSNLFDRMAYRGYVVDFLNIGIGNLRTGIFNIADVAITVGAIVLIVRSLKHERKAGF